MHFLILADPGKYLTDLAYIGLDGGESGVSSFPRALSVFEIVTICRLAH